MSRRVLLVVAVVALVGAAAPGGLVGQAAAGNTTIEFHEALDEQERTSQVTAQFTLNGDGTVEVRNQLSWSDVTFELVEWNDLDSGAGGGASGGATTQWQGVTGHTYRVTYEVTAQRSAAGSGGNTYYATPNDYVVQGPSGNYNDNLEATIWMLSPQFGTMNDRTEEFVFESSGSQSASISVTIPNTGDGVMVPENVEFNNVPNGIEASASGLPNQISGNGQGSFDVDVTVDDRVSESLHDFDVTVVDNLGNSRTFEVELDVIKPPVVGVSTIDAGDVLVGTSQSVDFTIEETLGFDGIDGIAVSGSTAGQFASIDFSGLRYVDTSPGGSDTASVTVHVDENAGQHATLQWTLTFHPEDPDGVSDTATVQARAVYPAEFGQAGFEETTFVFDEPRPSGEQNQEITVSVPNVGHPEFDSVSASASASGISAEVVGEPSSIGGHEEGEVTVRLSADADVQEGDYPLELRLSGSSDSGSDSRTYSTDIQVEHVPELDVGTTRLDYGEVRVTQEVTESTDIAEVLGYESVSGLSVEQVAGPDQWLSVTEAPEGQLSPGQAAPFEVRLTFDTQAEIFNEYTWRFEVSGDGVETKTITVTATPEPVNFDRFRDPLADRAGGSGWQAEAAEGVVTVLDTLETKMKSDSEVAASDLSIAVATGHSTLVFIDEAEAAEGMLAESNHTAAQGHLVRALAAYNVMDIYTSRLQDGELREPARSAVGTAEGELSGLVDQQTEYLEGRLDDGEASVLEQARINRQLARLEVLRGNDERAATLRQRSQEAFDSYVALVDEASATRQDARRQWAELHEGTLTVVLGRPLVLNPANWDAFGGQSADLLSTYDDAESTFREAGATAEADSVAATRDERAGQLQFARYSLYGSTVAYAVGFLGLLGYVGRNAYAFVRDAREAAYGDFLMPG